MMHSVYATNYSLTQTAIFVSDKMRNFLKLLVNRYGLNPEGVLDAWKEWVDRAVRWYLEHVPPELNWQDSHGVLDRRFYRH